MTKINNIKWLSLGIILTLLVSLCVPALAAKRTLSAELLYNDIAITLDGVIISPKDAAGNTVEPFIVDGTTYLPVRAIADALNIGVEWDGATNTVRLSSVPPSELPASSLNGNTPYGEYPSVPDFGDFANMPLLQIVEMESGCGYIYGTPLNAKKPLEYEKLLLSLGFAYYGVAEVDDAKLSTYEKDGARVAVGEAMSYYMVIVKIIKRDGAEPVTQTTETSPDSPADELQVPPSSTPSSSSSSSKSPSNAGSGAYITPTGSKYHYLASCAGKNAISTTLDSAINRGYAPCSKCAH